MNTLADIDAKFLEDIKQTTNLVHSEQKSRYIAKLTRIIIEGISLQSKQGKSVYEYWFRGPLLPGELVAVDEVIAHFQNVGFTVHRLHDELGGLRVAW